jgi:hypothetical protein
LIIPQRMLAEVTFVAQVLEKLGKQLLHRFEILDLSGGATFSLRVD